MDFALGFDTFVTCDEVSSVVENPLSSNKNINISECVDSAVKEDTSVNYFEMTHLEWTDPVRLLVSTLRGLLLLNILSQHTCRVRSNAP